MSITSAYLAGHGCLYVCHSERAFCDPVRVALDVSRLGRETATRNLSRLVGRGCWPRQERSAPARSRELRSAMFFLTLSSRAQSRDLHFLFVVFTVMLSAAKRPSSFWPLFLCCHPERANCPPWRRGTCFFFVVVARRHAERSEASLFAFRGFAASDREGFVGRGFSRDEKSGRAAPTARGELPASLQASP